MKRTRERERIDDKERKDINDSGKERCVDRETTAAAAAATTTATTTPACSERFNLWYL